METEWLFGIFPSIGRFVASSSFTFEGTTVFAALVLSLASDTPLVIDVVMFCVADEGSARDSSATTSADAVEFSSSVEVSGNSSNRITFRVLLRHTYVLSDP